MSLVHLGAALVVLMVDSALELAFISATVGYLHRSGGNQYPFQMDDGTTVRINAKPNGLLVNEGHTSNGAAGTALVLISFGGFLVLWLQRQRERKNTAPGPSKLFLAYTIFTILSFLLTLSALAYVFDVTNQTKGQQIDQVIAAQFQGKGYPLDQWTPETWTKALLALPLTSDTDRNYLRHWLHVMEGWKWNLIPLFLIGLVVAILTVRVHLADRRQVRK